MTGTTPRASGLPARFMLNLRSMNRWGVLCLIVLEAVFIFSAVDFALHASPTMDEPVAPALGYAELAAGTRSFKDVHPPLGRFLLALPLLGMDLKVPYGPERCGKDQPIQVCLNEFAGDFLFGQRESADALLFRSRMMTLALAAGLLAFLVWFSARLYGQWAGLIAGILFATNPEMIAHGSLATTDMPLTAFCFLSLAFLALYIRERKAAFLFAFSVAGALAFSTKFSAGPLLAAAALLLIAHILIGGGEETAKGSRSQALLMAATAAIIGIRPCQ